MAGPSPTEPVFRIGTRYFSTAKIDLQQRAFVLSERRAEAYKRLEIALGQQVRDFEFVDLGGRIRRLSDFKGKYVLLDFWGTWCGPCVANIPALKAAYDQYRALGFEVGGLDYDDELVTEREFARAQSIPWTLAAAESVKALIEDGFSIQAYPTLILLNRQGAVISFGRKGQPAISGSALSDTLRALFDAERK
jgi:thiol-disulfide isomerase/thioredoxin